MTLTEQLSADLKTAMKEKDVLVRDVVRMLKADLGKEEVQKGRALSDEEAVAVLQRAVKARRESVAEYEKGDRPEAAAEEQAEIAVVERYLPKRWSDDETRAEVERIVESAGLSGKAGLGQVMKALKPHGAKVDMKLASKIAGEVLAAREGEG